MKCLKTWIYLLGYAALASAISPMAFAQIGISRGSSVLRSTPAPRINSPAASSVPAARRTTVNVPTPQTTPSTGVPGTSGAGYAEEGDTGAEEGTDTSDSPNFVRPKATSQQLGRYRTAGGYVKVPELYLNSYKDSVVRVTALDEAGNKLSEAMGVAVGTTSEGLQLGDSNFIATPLSLVLGNALQWADRIEITHDRGTKYLSEVALIDEQLNLVLLKPKNRPTPIRLTPESQERAQIDVLTISFDRDRKSDIVPNVHRGVLAAINPEEGSLAVSGKEITNDQIGTGIINMNGELVGMLLPNGNGVMASAIAKAILKIKGKQAFSPRLVGAIMGRGALVDPAIKDAYKTVEEALADIKSGKAPKADPTRYLRAYTDEFKPKAAARPVLKIAPGVYYLNAPLELMSNISLTGSGPKSTILVAKFNNRPVITLAKAKESSIANLRITPPSNQMVGVPTVEIKDSENIILLGNVIESKGGRAAVHFQGSQQVAALGNSFPEGKEKSIYCQTSTLLVQANSFLGKWPQALAVGKGCSVRVESNLFVDNEIAIAVSGESRKLFLTHNTFLRDGVASRFYGAIPELNVEDNIFHGNHYSLLTNQKFNEMQIGRNLAWQSVAFRDNQAIDGLDFIKGKPEFRNADRYDFRLMPGAPGAGAGVPDREGGSTDIGAYQPDSYLGEYTSQFLITLETAVGEKDLAQAWGFKLTNGEEKTPAPEPKRSTASDSDKAIKGMDFE